MLWAAPLCFSHSFLSRAGLHMLNPSHWQHKQWAPQDAISDHYATSRGSWWPIGSSITVLADLAHPFAALIRAFTRDLVHVLHTRQREWIIMCGWLFCSQKQGCTSVLTISVDYCALMLIGKRHSEVHCLLFFMHTTCLTWRVWRCLLYWNGCRCK